MAARTSLLPISIGNSSKIGTIWVPIGTIGTSHPHTSILPICPSPLLLPPQWSTSRRFPMGTWFQFYKSQDFLVRSVLLLTSETHSTRYLKSVSPCIFTGITPRMKRLCPEAIKSIIKLPLSHDIFFSYH